MTRLSFPLLLLACLALAVPAQAADPAKYLFGAKRAPAEMDPDPHGSYARGCLAGAVELPETGPVWQAMRLSRNRNWGHPELTRKVLRQDKRWGRRVNWQQHSGVSSVRI